MRRIATEVEATCAALGGGLEIYSMPSRTFICSRKKRIEKLKSALDIIVEYVMEFHLMLIIFWDK